MISVEVVYGDARHQSLHTLQMPQGSTAQMAVVKSEIAKEFSEIDLNYLSLGIFSRPINPQTVVKEGDRIEIYRPLSIDPMQQRRTRAGLNHYL